MNNNNIHKKLNNVQRKLLKINIPKTGKNPFGDFEYYELQDLLPIIIEECAKEGLSFIFSFTEKKALLHIYDLDNENVEFTNCLIVPELRKLNRMNLVQSYGSYLTYLKRYLLLNTFLIGENSFIDSVASEINSNNHNNPKTHKSIRKNSLENQRAVVRTFDSAEDYLAFFEKQAKKSGLKLNSQNLFKYCTFERENNVQFKKFEHDVRKLISSKYNKRE